MIGRQRVAALPCVGGNENGVWRLPRAVTRCLCDDGGTGGRPQRGCVASARRRRSSCARADKCGEASGRRARWSWRATASAPRGDARLWCEAGRRGEGCSRAQAATRQRTAQGRGGGLRLSEGPSHLPRAASLTSQPQDLRRLCKGSYVASEMLPASYAALVQALSSGEKGPNKSPMKGIPRENMANTGG